MAVMSNDSDRATVGVEPVSSEPSSSPTADGSQTASSRSSNSLAFDVPKAARNQSSNATVSDRSRTRSGRSSDHPAIENNPRPPAPPSQHPHAVQSNIFMSPPDRFIALHVEEYDIPHHGYCEELPPAYTSNRDNDRVCLRIRIKRLKPVHYWWIAGVLLVVIGHLQW